MRFIGEVEGVPVLDRAFNRVEQELSDLRFIWPSVAKEVYKIEDEQFKSEGAHGASGAWAKLSPAYAKWKEAKFPGAPILQAYKSLYESLTSPDANASIFQPDKDQLVIGSKEPYAIAHQRGTGNMPARPPISFTEDDKTRITKAIQLPLVQIVRRQGFNVLERAA